MTNYTKKLRKLIRNQYKNDASKMIEVLWQSVERMGFWKRIGFCLQIMFYRR